MHADTGLLAVMGSVCMMLALVLASCLAGVRSSRFVKKCFPNPQYLLKAHLDFLMMTGLLFVFFLLFEHLRLIPPTAIVVAMSLGSVGNPSGFLALAVRPERPPTRSGFMPLGDSLDYRQCAPLSTLRPSA
jgi:O-antigen ligase